MKPEEFTGCLESCKRALSALFSLHHVETENLPVVPPLKRFSFKMFLFAAALLCISIPAHAQDKMVKVATLDDYSPYCFPKSETKSYQEIIPPGSDSANLQGYSWDVLKESFHAAGYTIKLSVYPWKRAEYDTKSGIEDVVFPISKSKKREEGFLYSKESVDQVNFLVYVPLDSTIQWQGIKSLNGLAIGQMSGWALGKEWGENDQIKKDNVNKIMQGFKMLDMGRLAGFAGYEINFDYVLKSENWKTKYRKLPSFDSSVEYVAGSKANPAVQQILDDFDSGRKKMIQSGTFALISKKWGVQTEGTNQ